MATVVGVVSLAVAGVAETAAAAVVVVAVFFNKGKSISGLGLVHL